jgi:hypothetical protein
LHFRYLDHNITNINDIPDPDPDPDPKTANILAESSKILSSLCVIQRLQQEMDENPDSLPFPEVKLLLCNCVYQFCNRDQSF